MPVVNTSFDVMETATAVAQRQHREPGGAARGEPGLIPGIGPPEIRRIHQHSLQRRLMERAGGVRCGRWDRDVPGDDALLGHETHAHVDPVPRLYWYGVGDREVHLAPGNPIR